MQRDELKTEIGKNAYDYSGIRKSSIPQSVLDNLVQSFTTRHELPTPSICYIHHDWFVEPVGAYVDYPYEPKLELYDDWRHTFYVHGYLHPTLLFEGGQLDEDEVD